MKKFRVFALIHAASDHPISKSFAFVGVHMSMHLLQQRCRRKKKHLVVQGQYTKASASYVEDLADALAESLADAISEMFQGDERLEVEGLENQLTNEIALSAPWEVMKSWAFKGKSHINILECSSFHRLVCNFGKTKEALPCVSLAGFKCCSMCT